MTCEYSWDGVVVLKTFTGFVSGTDFVATAERVSADRRFDRLMMIYNDFSRITGHSIDVKAYGRVAICRQGALATNPNFRVAFIATGENAAALRASIAPHCRGAPFDPLLFESLAEARSWFARQPALHALREHQWAPVKEPKGN